MKRSPFVRRRTQRDAPSRPAVPHARRTTDRPRRFSMVSRPCPTASEPPDGNAVLHQEGPPRHTPGPRCRDRWLRRCARHEEPEVDCKPGSVPPKRCRRGARTIPLGDALLRRSSALTRMQGPKAWNGPLQSASLFELAPGGVCPAAGHPAVARGLLPHDFTLACARGPSAVWFLRHFPSGRPGSPLATSLALWSPDFPPADGACPPAILRPPPARRC